MANIANVIEKAGQVMKDRRRFVRWSFQPAPDSVRMLTPEEQLERFLRLSPDSLRALTDKWGTEEVKRYVKSQLRNYRQYGNRH